MSDRLSVGVACFSTFGGSGVVAAEVAAALARRGHAVHVFSDARPARLPEGVPTLTFHPVEAPAYPQFGHDLYTLALASKIVDVGRAHGLDVVHAHYAIPHAVSAELARQVLAAELPARVTRVVTTLHGTDSTLVGLDPSFQPLTRFSVAGSDAVTAPSVWLAEATRRHLALPESLAIDVVPNFVDVARFAAAPAREGLPVVVHVSNFRPLKRVEDVVRVFARVRAARPARLRLVGDGPARQAVLELAASLGVAADVEWLGERDDLPALLAGAAAFLLPSASESFGLAALEALACGVPVVASNVGGLPEVVTDGEVGFLHAVGDVEAMATSVARLASDPALRARLGTAARAHAESRFPLEPAVDRYEAIYRRVLAD